MKYLLFALMLLGSIKSYSQTKKWSIEPSKRSYPAAYFENLLSNVIDSKDGFCICGILPKTHMHQSSSRPLEINSFDNSKSDTIPTILLCADTSKITSIVLMDSLGKDRFVGLTTPVNLWTQMITFTVVGYRVQGNILYTITSKKQLIDGITYLDDKKRPLPASFIVFSFVDRKQP